MNAEEFKGKPPRRVLIILMGAIGDVVRGLPLAVRLKRHWPSSEITWAVEPISRPLLEDHPAVDRLLVFDRPGGFPSYVDFVRRMRSGSYDLAIDLQRHFKSGVTSRLSGAPCRLGFDRGNARELNWLFNNCRTPAQDRFSPKIEQFQKFGDVLGLPPMERLEFGLKASAEEQRRIDEQLLLSAAGEPLPESAVRAAFLLGSTWQSRLWFAESYRRLIEELHERWGIVSVLVGSKGERRFADEILNGARRSAVVDLVERTSLRELAGVFIRCRLAVGSDSGPMHIAAAVGVPVISLWGATSPTRSGPYGSERYMLQSAIGCSPCYRRTCPGLGRLCMADLPVEAVCAAVERVFDEGNVVQ